MASSVSSEWAFSAVGITISKRCNRLQGDIVEAIKCIKCLLHHDLLFREVLNMAQLELELEGLVFDEELGMSTDVVSQGDEFSWDQLFVDEVDSEWLIDVIYILVGGLRVINRCNNDCKLIASWVMKPFDTVLCPKATAQAQAEPKPHWAWAQGLGLIFDKPEPSKAKPKLQLSGWAEPTHH